MKLLFLAHAFDEYTQINKYIYIYAVLFGISFFMCPVKYMCWWERHNICYRTEQQHSNDGTLNVAHIAHKRMLLSSRNTSSGLRQKLQYMSAWVLD